MRAFSRLGALIIIASALCTISATPAAAVPVGSLTFTYDGNAPDGTTIRIGVKFPSRPGSLPDVDFTMDISGNDRNQASARLETQLLSKGLLIKRVSPNSLDVFGTATVEIAAIAGGSTRAGFPVRLDGSDVLITRNLKPGSTWKVLFEPLFSPVQSVAGGSETVSLSDRLVKSLLVLSTPVPTDSTAEEAALLFDELLVASGLPDVGIQGAEVSFLLAPFDGSFLIAPDVADLAFDGSNLFYRLTFPETVVPEPGTLLLFGTGLLSLAAARAWRGRVESAPS
jgi:hypothetical protein